MHQSHLHLLVGIAEGIVGQYRVVGFDREVAALVEQRQHGVHVLGRSIEVVGTSLAAI